MIIHQVTAALLFTIKDTNAFSEPSRFALAGAMLSTGTRICVVLATASLLSSFFFIYSRINAPILVSAITYNPSIFGFLFTDYHTNDG